MKIAFLIDNDSVFNTPNFIKLIREIEISDNVKIDFLMDLKKCHICDVIFSFTKKFEEKINSKPYKVYKLYEDERVMEFINNDLFYYNEYHDEYEYNELFVYEKSVIRNIIKEFKEKNKEYLYSLEMVSSLEKDERYDFVTLNGEVPVIVSAPHNVSQYLNGIFKVSDYGSGRLAFSIMEKSKCYGIIKTRNIGNVFKNDNANKQRNCPYRKAITKMVEEGKIKALIDIHTLRRTRKEEINIGIDGGSNVFYNQEIIKGVSKIIKDNGFKLSIDNPFRAGGTTISKFASKKLGIYAIQIEINSKFVNYNYKSSKYNELVKMISEIVSYMNLNIKK